MGARVYTGLTRPAERLGVPINFWLAGSVVPMTVFITTQFFLGFWGLTVAVPMYFLMRWMAKHDSYFFSLLFTQLLRTHKSKNTEYWKGHSYASS
ncbi:VirB3 family type IV secretion system protein [Pelagibius sp. Alg239-R121]|uniref:VirB3 family type IV secretion system protein n=1 Tax=Pelagibius sp. Alg239-R121 TaxID=2993448 RepID=UPI0024A63EB5|nr:VirB3 family type IV secretion system protein [Pelagibius sp. Alg239-R121]